MNIHTELLGEARIVHSAADGKVIQDTGFQKNKILNQGLNTIGAGVSNNLMDSCIVGSGNASPEYTDTALNTPVKRASRDPASDVVSSNYVPDASNLYKISRTFKFVFTGLNNENISELGLASRYTSLSDYDLCTRMLVKDTNGDPTTITVLTGETLTIYYKLWMVFSTLDSLYVVNLSDGKGGLEPYNITTRMSNVGGAKYGAANTVSVGSTLASNSLKLQVSDFPIVAITSNPSPQSGGSGTASYATYTNNSYKRTINGFFGTSAGNMVIKSVYLESILGIFQFSISKASDSSFMTKTNQDTFAVSIDLSWGRYEGAL